MDNTKFDHSFVLARLEQVCQELTSTIWPETPSDGLRLTCQLSDDMRTVALAGFRHQHPHASQDELETLLYEFRLKWERVRPRIRVKAPFLPKSS